MNDQPSPPKRPPGRPRKDGGARRLSWLAFRVSLDERETIEITAAQTGRSVAAYMRDMVLTGRVIVQQRRELSSIDRADLGRVGSNLNQIARHLNAGRAVPPDAIEAALRDWIELAGRLE